MNRIKSINIFTEILLCPLFMSVRRFINLQTQVVTIMHHHFVTLFTHPIFVVATHPESDVQNPVSQQLMQQCHKTTVMQCQKCEKSQLLESILVSLPRHFQGKRKKMDILRTKQVYNIKLLCHQKQPDQNSSNVSGWTKIELEENFNRIRNV